MFKKKTRLFLVCARTDRLVPCGHEGHGYSIECARTWLRAAVGLTSLTLNVVGATLGGIATSSLPGSIVGTLAEQVLNTGFDNIASELENIPEAVHDRGIEVEHRQQVLSSSTYMHNRISSWCGHSVDTTV